MITLSRCFKYVGFWKEYFRFKHLTKKDKHRFTLFLKDFKPCLHDKTFKTNFDRHYVYHLGWASRILAMTKPMLHVDISSSLYFSTLVSAFVPVEFYDYRLADVKLENFTSKRVNLLGLPFQNKSIKSLSCMHVVEHIGLGRYGDVLDPDGDLKAISELKRVLSNEGILLFVVPIGKPKIIFNAHRIYSYQQIMDYFAGFQLKEFTLIPDHSENSGLIINATKEKADSQTYGCGCFLFGRS